MKFRKIIQKKFSKKTASNILIIGFTLSFTLAILSYYTSITTFKMGVVPRLTSSFLANSEAALDKCNDLKADNSLCIKLLRENTHREIEARKYLNHYQLNEQIVDFFGLQLINPFYFSIDIYKNNLSVQLNSLIEQRSDLTSSDRAKIKEKAQILIASQIDNTSYLLRNYYGLGGITFSILLMLFFAKLKNIRINNKVSNGKTI